MKLSHLVVLILLFFLCAGVHADVYRWINEAGIPEYSEHPRDGAEKVELGGSSTYAPVPYQKIQPSKSSSADTDAEQDIVYTLAIVKPVNDEGFLDNRGNVDVALEIDPPLNMKRGHKIELWLDNDDKIHESTSPNYQISGVERGTHTLTAQIRDSKGRVLGGPASVIFHLRHHSRLFKKP